jgi:uncharacterized protein (TIRG00374 family)
VNSEHGLRRLVSRRGAWALLLLLVVGLYGVVVAVAGGRDALAALRFADPWPLLGALLAQVLVTGTWPLVHRASVVAVGGRLRYPQALNVSMSAFTVSHTVPGGGAVGAAVVVERLTGFGVPGPVAAASATLTGPIVLTTVVVLGVLGLTGAVLAGELTAVWLVAGVIGLAALLALLAVIVVGLRSPALGERVIAAAGSLHRRLRRRSDAWQRSWRRVTDQEVSARQLAPILGWAACKWVADIGSLALVFLAFGQTPRLTAILVGIAVAQLGAAVPLTPGGVGFVEGGLVAAFAAMGVDLPVATAVALTYRVLETWLPSIAGVPMLLRPPASNGDASAQA